MVLMASVNCISLAKSHFVQYLLACLEHEGFIQTLILLELFMVLLYKGDMA